MFAIPECLALELSKGLPTFQSVHALSSCMHGSRRLCIMFSRNGFSVQEPQNLHEAAKAGDIEAARKFLNEVSTHIHAYINSLNSWHQSTATVLQLINGPCKM